MKKPFLSDFSIILILFFFLMMSLGWIGYDFYQKYKEHQESVAEAVRDTPSELPLLKDVPPPP